MIIMPPQFLTLSKCVFLAANSHNLAKTHAIFMVWHFLIVIDSGISFQQNISNFGNRKNLHFFHAYPLQNFQLFFKILKFNF